MGALARTSNHHQRSYNAWRCPEELTYRLGREYLAHNLPVFTDLHDCAKIRFQTPLAAVCPAGPQFS